jgi:sulfatase modifying factor 1
VRALDRIALPRRRDTLVGRASLPARAQHACSSDLRSLPMIRTATFALALALSASLAPAQVTTYCTAGTTVQGCVPSISGVGCPSAGTASGFDIVTDNVPTQRMGLIFYGLSAIPQPQPWAVGSASYLCVYYPVNRTGAHNSGGSLGPCDGELRVDFNSWRAVNPAALGSPFTTGQIIYAQGWFRDPGAAKQTNLSDALSFVLQPTCSTLPGMVVIPSGTFDMGSNAASGPPYYGGTGTQPVHTVTISYSFWMGSTEVTQAQYSALMGNNPSLFVGANHPVEQVTWFDAQLYCAALTAQQSALGNVPPGYHYRLPTEAEWEYACRAGATTEFSVGAELVCHKANFAYSYHSNSSCNSTGSVPVGSYAPNVWGLHDMHGNMLEWCLDSYQDYSHLAATDPFVTGGPLRVIRGGRWDLNSNACRSAIRGATDPAAYGGFGFRVVLAPILVP